MKQKNYTDYYLKKQLCIDKALIRYRFEAEQEFFLGSLCLEMGPADGVMTELLVNHFKEIHVVDGDKELLNTIPEHENLVKYHSWFEEFEPTHKYDTIIMEHILEHISNPMVVLEKVKKWLNIGGVLIAGVPNAKSFHRLAAVKMGMLKTEYELNDRDISQGHQRVYDIDMLVNEINSSGFSVIHKGGVFLKFLSNQQIEDNWSKDLIQSYYEIGKDFQQNAADIFVVAKIC